MTAPVNPLRALLLAALACAVAPARAPAAAVSAVRFAENPLVTVRSDPSLGDNVNGPSIIKVPAWVKNPLGKYYMYFAHHRGTHIRLAYADSLHGPWKVYVPGVLDVSATALYRPQPDPPYEIYGVYTHVASPEVLVDDANQRIIMWVHGQFSDGKRWPDDPRRGARVAAPERIQPGDAGDGVGGRAALQGAARHQPGALPARLRARRRVLRPRAPRAPRALGRSARSRSRTVRIRSAIRRTAARCGTLRCTSTATRCTSSCR